METSLRKAKAIMLPTDGKAPIKLGPNVESFKRPIAVATNTLTKQDIGWNLHGKPQHLYIVSDEEIKEGRLQNGDKLLCDERGHKSEDPIYTIRTYKETINGWLMTYEESGQGENPDWTSKVIATTDESLNNLVGFDTKIKDTANKSLPQPSESFIKAFIKAYNEGEQIVDVLVEYGLHWVRNTSRNIPTKDDLEERPKVDSHNCITIKKVKDSYTIEEYVANVKRLINLYATTYNGGNIDNWIKENL